MTSHPHSQPESARETKLHDAELIVRQFTFDGHDGNRARKALDLLLEAALRSPVDPGREAGFVKPDNDRQIFFYEQDFYILSNFSAFEVEWSGFTFKTSEHLYHWMRFTISNEPNAQFIAGKIMNAHSAHDAFKIAQECKASQVSNWNEIKCGFMKQILHAKADQHEYVHRKLLATGDRELIEDSWRDDFWGWGPNRDGQNMLGKLWMEVRSELRADLQRSKT